MRSTSQCDNAAVVNRQYGIRFDRQDRYKVPSNCLHLTILGLYLTRSNEEVQLQSFPPSRLDLKWLEDAIMMTLCGDGFESKISELVGFEIRNPALSSAIPGHNKDRWLAELWIGGRFFIVGNMAFSNAFRTIPYLTTVTKITGHILITVYVSSFDTLTFF